MAYFRKNSLRNEIKKQISERHRLILPAPRSIFAKYLDLLSQRGYWWIVFLNILGLLIITSLIDIKFLEFINLSDKTSETLIDQRTSNVATLISMTLAVVGLLLSNLAIKDRQTYKLLFTNSRLYFTIYFTLSTIFFLILISTFRDWIKEVPNLLPRMVLIGSYLALSVLFFVGHLFRSIINFSDSSKIFEVLKREFFEEAKMKLVYRLWIKYSRQRFEALMSELQIHPNPGLSRQLPEYQLTNLNPEEDIIYDIDLVSLKSILGSPHNWYYNQRIALNISLEKSYFLTSDDPDMPGNTNAPYTCLKLKKRGTIPYTDEYGQYFYKKLLEYTTEQRTEKVEEMLGVYLELYKLEMEHDT